MANLKQALYKRVGLDDKTKDNDTVGTYKRGLRQFVDYMQKEYKINKINKIFGNEREYIQSFEKSLENRGLTASTIHTYIQPVCLAFNINAKQIIKPKRVTVTKGRDLDANKQGQREETQERFQPSVMMAKATGFRRRELKHITLNMLTKDSNGSLCIRLKGKGGKVQYQRILPSDAEYVKNIFEKAYDAYTRGEDGMTREQAGKQKLFSDTQFVNKINYHKFRREFGQKAYEYYLNRVKTEPDKVIFELVNRWNSHHSETPKPDKNGNKRYNEKILINVDQNGNYTYRPADPRSKAVVKYLKDLYPEKTYSIRGSNRDKALRLGVSIQYNQLALRCVSVFELAHWRDDVTVKHYMLD